MEQENIRNKLIKEICLEKNIEIKSISYDWIQILKKNNIERKIINYQLNINSEISKEIAEDKYATYEILKLNNIPVIKHDIIFNSKFEESNIDSIIKNNNKVVIKLNTSSQGKDVYIAENYNKKVSIINKLFLEGNDAVCISPYENIESEYRVFYLFENVEYIYKKIKPFVIGDGKRNLSKLTNKNSKFDFDLQKDYIPKENEKVNIGWKHNLSCGAIPIVIDKNDKNYKEVSELACKVGKIIDTQFSAIDIAVTEKNDMYVMEVNATNVGISKFCELIPEGYNIVKKIYSKIIDKMFKK